MTPRQYPPPPRPEPFWPALGAVLAAIVLQVVLPGRLLVGPRWLLGLLEGALALGLTLTTPRRLEREHRARRRAAITLTALVSIANALSLALLTHYLLHHSVMGGAA